MYDIVVPCHPKDYGTLELCVQQIKRHLVGWNRIHVITAAQTAEWDDGELDWVPEPEPQSVADHYERRCSPHTNRVGWLHQTLLKLEARKHIPDLASDYLCIDADVLFLRPVPFVESEQWFQYHKWTLHPPYKDVFERLTGIIYPVAHGFVMHHMMYRQERLDGLIAHIQEHTGCDSLESAVLEHVNVLDQSPFAECDTFGAWMLNRWIGEIEHRPLRILEKSFIPRPPWLAVYEHTDIDLVACHAYMRDPPNAALQHDA